MKINFSNKNIVNLLITLILFNFWKSDLEEPKLSYGDNYILNLKNQA